MLQSLLLKFALETIGKIVIDLVNSDGNDLDEHKAKPIQDAIVQEISNRVKNKK